MLVVIESIVCFALTVASLVGNTMLCLAVYRNPRLRSTTNLYIIALSVGDLICATLEMPLTFWTLVVGRWIFGDGVCQLHGFVDVFSTYCPPATMALTAFNRYIRIVKTGYYRKIFSPWRSKLWLFCVWFLLISYFKFPDAEFPQPAITKQGAAEAEQSSPSAHRASSAAADHIRPSSTGDLELQIRLTEAQTQKLALELEVLRLRRAA